MKIGDAVKAINGQFHDAFSIYPAAIVVGLDPLVLLSGDGSMCWYTKEAKDVEVIGVAGYTEMQNCYDRVLETDKHLASPIKEWLDLNKPTVAFMFERLKEYLTKTYDYWSISKGYYVYYCGERVITVHEDPIGKSIMLSVMDDRTNKRDVVHLKVDHIFEGSFKIDQRVAEIKCS